MWRAASSGARLRRHRPAGTGIALVLVSRVVMKRAWNGELTGLDGENNGTKWSGKCQGDNSKDIRHRGRGRLASGIICWEQSEHFMACFENFAALYLPKKSTICAWTESDAMMFTSHSIILISGVMISADEREFSANCFDKERVELIRSLKVSIRLFPNVMGHLSTHPNYRRFWEQNWVRTHLRSVAACH